MAGRTGIEKKKERKQVLDKDYLYGKWSKEMDEDELGKGVDEAQAAGAAALTEKPKYKGWKSDLAFIEAQKKKKEAAKKKKKAARLKKATPTGPVAGTEYKTIKGEDYVKTKKSVQAVRKNMRKKGGRTGIVKANLYGR